MGTDAVRILFDRHSCRSFGPDPIPEGDMRTLMDALRWAPSAGNMQPWVFLVVTNRGVKKRLAEAAYGQRFVQEAPVVFVVCGDPEASAIRYGDRGRTLYYLQDTAAATENLLLAATALGYGSCWVGAFDEDLAREALSLESRLRPVAMVPVGKGDIPRKTTDRKPESEVLRLIE